MNYEEMKGQVMSSHEQTASTRSEASSLLKQRQEIEIKQKALEAFKAHFIMTEDEISALTLTAEPVDEEFFRSLKTAKRINKDCEVLLGFETQHLGLELMEQLSKNINVGFQKLYKWVQREFKTLNLENPQMNPAIRRSLRVLAERPSLFQNCLDFFAEARERILSDAFYVALTGTGSSGEEVARVKPIDLAAHDPLRYVGDMLAWIHSATVSEYEALEVLFVAEGEELAKGLKFGRDAEVWRLVADEDFDKSPDFNALKALKNLVDTDMSGATRVLRQRIYQVIQSNEDILQAYKLANLVNFYLITFRKLLGSESNLVQCVGDLEIEALRQFRALVRDHVAGLQGEFQQTPSDLGPPKFLQDSLKQLDTIAKTYDSSLSSVPGRESEFEPILEEAFEPFISGCENMAKSMRLPESAIFIVNCNLAATGLLQAYEFTESRAETLSQHTYTATNSLTQSQFEFLLAGSGLVEIVNRLQRDNIGKFTAADERLLSQSSQQLDDFLPSALIDAMERLKHLQASSLAQQITEKAIERFCNVFEELEKAVMEANEKLKESDEEPVGLRSIFPRTTAEIRILLS